MLLILQLEFPSLTENGCTTTGDIEWVEEAFPAEVEEQEMKTMARMKMIMVVMGIAVMTRTTTMYFEA